MITLVVDPPDPSYICSIPPRSVMNNTAFVVDTSIMASINFIMKWMKKGFIKGLAEEVRLIQAFLVGNGSHYKGATMNTRTPVIQVEQGTFTELFPLLQVINYVQRTFNLVVKQQLLRLMHLKLITILYFSVVIHFTTSTRVSDLQEPIIFLFQLVVMTILPIFIPPCACYPISRLIRK